MKTITFPNECMFHLIRATGNGDLWLSMTQGSAKARDLLRDPRVEPSAYAL
jgi:hypothetical protein